MYSTYFEHACKAAIEGGHQLIVTQDGQYLASHYFSNEEELSSWLEENRFPGDVLQTINDYKELKLADFRETRSSRAAKGL